MKKAMKIRIILPWFGNWPPWMEYFLLSCRYNPDIIWLLLGDGGTPASLPGNVRYLPLNISDFNEMASRKLSLRIRIKHPYKICDLRPAFGLIFEDYLKSTDFWGYSDLDVIYGNIRHFISDEILRTHDVISTRAEYLSGHFCISRNTPSVNQLYMASPVFMHVFEDSSRHYAFDERTNITGRRFNGSKPACEKILNRVKILFTSGKRRYPADMNQVTQMLSDRKEIRLYRRDMVRSDLWYSKRNISDWGILWKEGILTDTVNNEDLLHFHFIRSKHNRNFRVFPLAEKKQFAITAGGISPLIY